MTSLRAFLVVLLLAACADPPTQPRPITELPRPLSSSEQRLIGASNRFAWDLFREMTRERPGENVFVSPLSASMALGMTTNGARGATLDSMRATLGFGAMPLAEINRSYRSLLDLLRGVDPATEMLIANSIWYRRGYNFEPAFFDTTKRYFDAEVAALDFADPAAPRTINAWVDRGTNGRIKSIVEQIRPNEVMYLVNAIYFKGTWRQQFAKNRTRDDGFTTSGGVRVPVKMMHQDSTQRYLETPEFQAVDMPYGNGAFAMTVILPAPGRDAGALVASLGPERWAEWLGRFAEQRVDLYLPRFRLEYESSFNDALKALGMEIAFDDQRADFTGMASSGGIYISEVFQKTFVDVNEEGTEAAAVTKVVMGVTSAPMRASMRVDRPFIVAIRERFSGTLLFVGLIESPPA